MGRSAVVLLGLLLSGCSYTVEPTSVAEFTAVTAFAEKLPGKYLYYAEGTELKRSITPTGVACSFHTYPLDLADTLANSSRRTLQNYVEDLEVVPSPATVETFDALGARGIIIVRGEDIDADIRAIPGFWENSMEAEVNVTASIQVDGPDGRLLGVTVEGDGNAKMPAGFACGGGADALKQASEEAMRETVRRLAEAVANSELLRSASGV